MSAKKKTTRRPRPARKKPPPVLDPRDRELELHREELATQNEEMRETNAELSVARERYALLYDVAPVGYFTLDGDRRIVEANLMAGDLLGVARQTLFGRRLDELVTPASRGAFQRFVRQALAEGGLASHETVFAARSGPIPVRVERAVLAPSVATRRAQVLLCVSDDRGRKRVEEERRSRDAKTAETDRLESLGLLAAGIAHEFNNALAIVLTCADLALRDLTAESPARGSLVEARAAAERAAELSRQMLAYTGRTQLESELVDVSTLVDGLDSLLRAGIGKEVRLEVDLARGLPLVDGDPVKLRQIVVNLVVNASEAFCGRGGTIAVRTRGSSDEVSITVSDDGPGMDDDVVRHVFDPFFSTKVDGRGLGLAVADGLARAHGGTITVESAPGRGSTFRLALPARQAAAPSAPHLEGQLTILVTDDDPAMRAALGVCLRRLGYECVFASDGREAVTEVAQRGADLALVLLDLRMPGMDGRAALSAIVELRPDLPVVLMSGYSDGASTRTLPGATAFMAKPFDLAGLERTVKAALSRSRLA